MTASQALSLYRTKLRQAVGRGRISPRTASQLYARAVAQVRARLSRRAPPPSKPAVAALGDEVQDVRQYVGQVAAVVGLPAALSGAAGTLATGVGGALSAAVPFLGPAVGIAAPLVILGALAFSKSEAELLAEASAAGQAAVNAAGVEGTLRLVNDRPIVSAVGAPRQRANIRGITRED